MILSLILYGSRARGDHRHVSDVDLLGLVEFGAIDREPPVRGANLHLVPYETFYKQCERGNLFSLHIVEEGKVLSDKGHFFRTACDRFKFKSSYQHEIEEATVVALFFASNESFSPDRRDVRKRLFWALRTMMIARAAEERVIAFGAADLEKFSGISGLKTMIDKRSTLGEDDVRKLSRAVLKQFGSKKAIKEWPIEKMTQLQKLISFSTIARSTAAMLHPPLQTIDLAAVQDEAFYN